MMASTEPIKPKDQLDVAPMRPMKPIKPTKTDEDTGTTEEDENLQNGVSSQNEDITISTTEINQNEKTNNADQTSDDSSLVSAGSGDGGGDKETIPVSNNNQKQETDIKDEPTELELADENDIGNTVGKDRDDLFYKGRALEKAGKQQLALKYYLQCLKSLEKDSTFSFMPQCLHSMANIYYAFEEYEKAVQFIQAEKLYYETALIDTCGMQKKLEKDAGLSVDEKSKIDETLGIHGDAIRAEEYDNLARLCLEKKQPQLALEYCGKSTKLRQQVYGENHPLTLKSLDFFTVVYAEAGKEKYQESLDHLHENSNSKASSDVNSNCHVERDGLRRRKVSAENESRHSETSQHLQQRVSSNSTREQEENISLSLLWILFFLMVCVLCLMGAFLTCRMSPNDQLCISIKSYVHYIGMRMKFYYYYYTDDGKDVHA